MVPLLCRAFGHKPDEWMEVCFVDGSRSWSRVRLMPQVVSSVDPVKARNGTSCSRCGLRLSERAWRYAECKVHGKIGETDEEVVRHFKEPHDDARSMTEKKGFEARVWPVDPLGWSP